jgi:prephenate dehydrogenase
VPDCPTAPTMIIAGLGLMGGSLAACWSQAGYHVVGVARQADTQALALQRGWVHQAYATVHAALRPNAWLVLCGPLSQNTQWLNELAPTMMTMPGLYVTDIGSCKRQIVALGQHRLPGRFLGGHPMAGKAVTGLQHAEATLFADRPYILCPPLDEHAAVPPAAMDTLTQAIATTGARLLTLNAATHDEMMAWVSHVPQLYSLALAHSLTQRWGDAFTTCSGPALTEHLRLSTSAYSMWHDIFAQNGDNMTTAWTHLTQQGHAALATPEDLRALFRQ